MFRFKLRTLLIAVVLCGIASSFFVPFAWTSVSVEVTDEHPRKPVGYYGMNSHTRVTLTNRGLLPVWYSRNYTGDPGNPNPLLTKLKSNSKAELNLLHKFNVDPGPIELTDWLGRKRLIWVPIEQQ